MTPDERRAAWTCPPSELPPYNGALTDAVGVLLAAPIVALLLVLTFTLNP
jgi:hypothetical protein